MGATKGALQTTWRGADLGRLISVGDESVEDEEDVSDGEGGKSERSSGGVDQKSLRGIGQGRWGRESMGA